VARAQDSSSIKGWLSLMKLWTISCRLHHHRTHDVKTDCISTYMHHDGNIWHEHLPRVWYYLHQKQKQGLLLRFLVNQSRHGLASFSDIRLPLGRVLATRCRCFLLLFFLLILRGRCRCLGLALWASDLPCALPVLAEQ
jgi:hypothetical protein